MKYECRTCSKSEPEVVFYKNVSKCPDCKSCRSKKDKETYKNNSIKFIERTKKFRQENPEKIRDCNLKRNYSVSLEEYNKKLLEQNNKCEICGKHENDNMCRGRQIPLANDHHHESKQNRGLLCVRCNLALGALEEDSEVLYSMINYINKYQKLR